MIELIKLDETILLDIRYARSDNFVGHPVYPEARAFLQEVAANSLVAAHRRLRKVGLGIVIFDAYRPWSVTKLFWQTATEDQRPYIADPAVGSRHNRGCAVDLSLYDLSTKQFLKMPTNFDEFNSRAHTNYTGGTRDERRNRDLLIETMESFDFTANSREWWHYDHRDWEKYEVMDKPFDEVV